MKIIKSLYTILKEKYNTDSIEVSLVFNENHPIYRGHFPEKSIVPGVCVMKTAKQLLQKHLNLNLQIDKILYLKFLKLLIPNNNKQIIFIIKTQRNIDSTITMSFLVTDFDRAKYTNAKIIYKSV
jgi:3-hydroxyacyl-[acyl-carrier-protein] dehydratase